VRNNGRHYKSGRRRRDRGKRRKISRRERALSNTAVNGVCVKVGKDKTDVF